MKHRCWFCGTLRKVWWFPSWWAVCQPCVDRFIQRGSLLRWPFAVDTN